MLTENPGPETASIMKLSKLIMGYINRKNTFSMRLFMRYTLVILKDDGGYMLRKIVCGELEQGFQYPHVIPLNTA